MTYCYALIAIVLMTSTSMQLILCVILLFTHVWQRVPSVFRQLDKPNTGFVYQIMKRTRHQYHYAVCCCKKNQLNIQKQKLAENMSSSSNLWKELKKISRANQVTTNVMDNAHGDKNVMELLLTKYKTLYNSVPTSDDELQHLNCIIGHLNCIIGNGISDFKEQGMFSTPDLVHKIILQLKKSKDDWNVGFKSDHLINGGIAYMYFYLFYSML